MKNTKFLKLVLLSMIFISSLNAFDFGFITKLFSKKIVKSGNIKSNDTIKKVALSISSGILLGSAVLFVYWFSHRDKNKQNSNSGQDNNDKNHEKIKNKNYDHKDSVTVGNKEAVKNNETEPNSKENISKKTDNKSDNQGNKEKNAIKETKDNKISFSVEPTGNSEKRKTKEEIEKNEENFVMACKYKDIESMVQFLEEIDIDRAKELINENKIEENFILPDDSFYKNVTLKMVQLMVSLNMNLNCRNNEGGTMLHEIYLNNDPNIAKFLLENGAKPLLSEKNNRGQTPLHRVLERKLNEYIKIFIEYCSNECINESDRRGRTALHYTIIPTDGFGPFDIDDRFNISNLLLKHGAVESIDKPDNYGYTPFHGACDIGDYKILELFLELYPHEFIHELINKPDKEGKTPLHYSCTNTLNLLLKNGAKESINKPDNKGYTPLHIACDNDSLETVKILIENGDIESINKLTEKKESPLIFACRKKNTSIVKLLLENGADGNFYYFESTCKNIFSIENINEEILSYIHLAYSLDNSENKLKTVNFCKNNKENKDFLCKRLLTKHKIVYYKD